MTDHVSQRLLDRNPDVDPSITRNDVYSYIGREPNIPELRKTVEWVEAQAQLPHTEREWNQQHWISHLDTASREMFKVPSWHCGTVACFAGHVGMEHGAKSEFVSLADGSRVHIRDYASYILGLSEWQARELYKGNNTASDIRRICEEIAGEPL